MIKNWIFFVSITEKNILIQNRFLIAPILLKNSTDIIFVYAKTLPFSVPNNHHFSQLMNSLLTEAVCNGDLYADIE